MKKKSEFYVLQHLFICWTEWLNIDYFNIIYFFVAFHSTLINVKLYSFTSRYVEHKGAKETISWSIGNCYLISLIIILIIVDFICFINDFVEDLTFHLLKSNKCKTNNFSIIFRNHRLFAFVFSFLTLVPCMHLKWTCFHSRIQVLIEIDDKIKSFRNIC